MLISRSHALLCLDETNSVHLFKDNRAYNLSSAKEEEVLSTKEKAVMETMQTYVNTYETQFLDTTHLYPHHAKRKLFYSFHAHFYFILVWDEAQKITIHPFKELDALLFQEGAKEEEVSAISTALAMELGRLQHDPLLAGVLE